MRVLVFSGGSIDAETVDRFWDKVDKSGEQGSESGLLQEKPTLVIAADRGLAFCKHQGIRPDYIVGDFDSLEEPELVEEYRSQGIPVETFRPEKDMTDTDIAAEKAIALGADEVVFFGATGSRMDHTLSNIFNLYKLTARGIKASLVDKNNRISMPIGNRVLLRREDQYGSRISLFPFRGDLEGVTLKGMKYPLDQARLVQGDGGLAVSNEIVEEEAEITWTKGTLILMETLD